MNNLEQLAKEAFDKHDYIEGSLSGGIEAPRIIISTEQEGDKVSITWRNPETCGLSDCRYHNIDTAPHTDTFRVVDGLLYVNGNFEDIFGVRDWPDYQQTVSDFFNKWGLKNDPWIGAAAKDDGRSEEEEAFIDKCYEAYRLDWCISHGFGIEDLLNTLQKALEDDVVDTGIIDSADEMALAMENALGVITDQGLSNGTLWVCKGEFLDNEFLDKDYMEHLIDLMPDKEAGRKMYRKITGTSFDEEHLEVCTSAGVLKAYRSTDPGQPGICVMLNPSGYEEEIDMSYVSVYENPGYVTSDGERPVDVSIMTYGNPYDENYTSKVLIRREDVMAALCKEKGGDGYAKAG